MKKVKKSDAIERQLNRYQVNIKLDPEYDKDIIEVLKQVDKKQTFIKDCIRHLTKDGKKRYIIVTPEKEVTSQ